MGSKINILLLLFLPVLGMTQARQQVTNMAGFDISVPDFIVTSSIGEPAILTFTNTNLILTFSYYPNPAKGEITIEAYGCEVQIQLMDLFDSWGRKITSIKPSKDNKVQLGDISPGAYFIKILLTNGDSKSIKIIKVGT
jgi:hypothetical protein